MANPVDKNEGEGNKTADKHYRDHITEFLQSEDPEKLARQAAHDVAADPERYKDAEEEGKRHIAEEDPELEE